MTLKFHEKSTSFIANVLVRFFCLVQIKNSPKISFSHKTKKYALINMHNYAYYSVKMISLSLEIYGNHILLVLSCNFNTASLIPGLFLSSHIATVLYKEDYTNPLFYSLPAALWCQLSLLLKMLLFQCR